jgi:hypothetical protein
MARLEYWLQIENHPWDTAPGGLDRRTGATFTRGANGMFKPLAQDALIIRRYTPNWAAPADLVLNPWDLAEPDPAQTHGTIPGATLEAKVGDDILVHFRNKDERAGLSAAQRTHSLHAGGVNHKAFSDGAFPLSPSDAAQANKQGDRVAPGESFTYAYSVLHSSTAGVWFYHDYSIEHQASILQGAFGAIIVRGGGESKSILPARPLHTPGDTATTFARVPAPPPTGEHLLFLHELADAGICVNGRQLLGNVPVLLARLNTRVKFRVINFTRRAQTFHIHGHRWRRGDDWVDTRELGVGEGLTFEVLEGTSEGGGTEGEWLLTLYPDRTPLASLVVTEGGPLRLSVASGL